MSRDRWMAHYKLEGRKIVRCSLIEWGQWLEQNASGPRKDDQRIVAKTRIGDLEVSTVFLGIDHGFHNPYPVLWETMVFEPNPEAGQPMQLFDRPQPDSIEAPRFPMERCSGGFEQAEEMHERKVQEVEQVLGLGRLKV